ncbi:MAG: phage portal protein [Maricaulaceae bacterium]
MKNWIKSALSSERSNTRLNADDWSHKSQANRPLIALQLPQQASWGGYNFSGKSLSGLSHEAYQRNAIAYRCVRLIAESAASVDFQITRNGRIDETDPLSRAFAHTHIETSFTEVLEAFYGYLQLTGNGYLEAIKCNENIVGFRALRPDRVEVKTSANGYKIGYVHRINNQTRLIKDDLTTGQCGVFHQRVFNPVDDHYGFAPMKAASRAVDLHNEGARWVKALLDNSARPSGALIYKGASGGERLSGEQFDRLKAELEQAHTGAERAGRPMLLEGGLDWKAMSLTPTDMDFLNARREAAREIALAFGVPPMLLGIPGDNTYANYKEANLAFWRTVVLPLVKKTSHGLQRWLRSFYGPDVEICVDMDGIIALSAERSALWERLQSASFLTDSERRKMAGLPTLEADNG